MKISFVLNAKAFSVNRYYYRTRSIKTREACEWEVEILQLLEEYKELHDMADAFKESGGVFHIEFCFVYPKHIFFNAQGKVSAKTFDVTNVEKPMVDLIMNNFMQIDDRFLTSMKSAKKSGPIHQIEVSITLKQPAQ